MHFCQWSFVILGCLAVIIQSVPMPPNGNRRMGHVKAPFESKEGVIDYFMTGKGKAPSARYGPTEIMASFLEHQDSIDVDQFTRIWAYFTKTKFSEKIASQSLRLIYVPSLEVVSLISHSQREPFMHEPLQWLARIVHARYFLQLNHISAQD